MLTDYLNFQAGKGGQQDWQFIQMVDALRILFIDMVKPAWASSYPWQRWKDAARGH